MINAKFEARSNRPANETTYKAALLFCKRSGKSENLRERKCCHCYRGSLHTRCYCCLTSYETFCRQPLFQPRLVICIFIVSQLYVSLEEIHYHRPIAVHSNQPLCPNLVLWPLAQTPGMAGNLEV